jgi:hypothetical protein
MVLGLLMAKIFGAEGVAFATSFRHTRERYRQASAG